MSGVLQSCIGWTCRTAALGVLLCACGRAGYEGPLALDLDRTELVFTARTGEIVTAQKLIVSNPSGGSIEWVAGPSASWILVVPASGGTPSTVAVRVEPVGLLPGEHRGTLTFSASGGQSDRVLKPVTVWVRLILTAPGWVSGNGPYGGPVYGLAADGVRGGRVLAGDGSGRIWISDDGGETFRGGQSLGGAIKDIVLDSPSGVAYSASDSNGVWKSPDAGETWQLTGVTGPVSQLAVKPGQPETVYVLAMDTLGLSTDGGTTWRNLVGNASCVATGAGDPNEVFACMKGDKVRRSTDEGQTWEEFSLFCYEGLSTLRDPLNPTTLLVSHASCDYVSRSTNNGQSWALARGVPAGNGRMLRRIGARLLLTHTQGLFESPDGALWTEVPSVGRLPTPGFHALADAGGVPLATHGLLGVMIADGPLRASSGIVAHALRDLEVHPATGDLVGLSNVAGVWRFDRKSERWGSTSDPTLYGGMNLADAQCLVQDPADADRLLLGFCNGGILESLDGGETWSPTGAGAGNCVMDLKWAADDPSLLYAASCGQVVVSRNRGAVFDLVTPYPLCTNQVAPLPGGKVLFSDDHVATYLYSGGSPESLTPTGYNARLAVAPDGGAWIAGANGVWYLPPGATVAEARGGGGGQDVPFTGIVVDGSRVWLASNGLGLRFSDDNGKSWQDSGCPSKRVTAVTQDPADGSLWVGTRDLGVLRFNP